MFFSISFTEKKVSLMAHTADVKFGSTFPSKTRYFSLASGTKIEKIDIFNILGISTMDLKYYRKKAKSYFLNFKGVI